MNTYVSRSKLIISELGDGLILRHVTLDDIEELAEFNGRVHSPEGWEKAEDAVSILTRDMMTRPHPTFRPEYFLVVEDVNTKQIVSSSNLIPQLWSFQGIEFSVGRPELVGTHPDYRRRGLIRAQFNELHRMSARLGHKMQAITGIPWYYRQFGYEMCVNLGGGYEMPIGLVPPLKKDEQEPYDLRPTRADDLDFITSTYAKSAQRHTLFCIRDEETWLYALQGKTKGSAAHYVLCTIENSQGNRVGFVAHSPKRSGPIIELFGCEIEEGLSWMEIAPSILRYLKTKGMEYNVDDEKHNLERIKIALGESHPLYDAFPQMQWKRHNSYAWYIRIPNLVDFLNALTPALGQRVQNSLISGFTGDVKLNFYDSGVIIMFEDGRIKAVKDWRPVLHEDEGLVRFPNFTFYQVLLGYRSFSEVEYAYADCYGSAEAKPILDVLFPRKPSNLWFIS
jgi:hypothetical protein